MTGSNCARNGNNTECVRKKDEMAKEEKGTDTGGSKYKTPCPPVLLLRTLESCPRPDRACRKQGLPIATLAGVGSASTASEEHTHLVGIAALETPANAVFAIATGPHPNA